MEAKKDPSSGKWHIEGLEPSYVTFKRMKQMIEDGVNFKFARYGDGEMNCMVGKKGANCDGHEYFEDLGERLKESFSDKVMTGVQPLLLTLPQGQTFLELIRDKGLSLYNADVLHNAMIDLQMSTFLELIEKSGRYVVVVGPAHLRSFFVEPIHFIEIPELNCWLMYEETKSALADVLMREKSPVVLLCASMMSEVLIRDFVDVECCMIDCGSVFDPFVNVKSRKYHNKLAL